MAYVRLFRIRARGGAGTDDDIIRIEIWNRKFDGLRTGGKSSQPRN